MLRAFVFGLALLLVQTSTADAQEIAARISPATGWSWTASDAPDQDSARTPLASSKPPEAAAAPTEDNESPSRPLGSAFFGGDGGPPIFGPVPATEGKEAAPWPNISEPGPDMGDFPNSAFTLPRGRIYIEMAPATFVNSSTQNPPAYLWPFLLRYGVTDDVEFRIFGNGLTRAGGSSPFTGFSPLNLDLKVHLWNDRKEWLIPAMSLEVFLQTTWASPQLQGGWHPSINLNFDLPITKRIGIEWTLGYSGVQEVIDIHTQERFVPSFNIVIPGIQRQFTPNFNQFKAQWAIEYEVNDRLSVFFHGFHNGAILLSLGSGEMVGAGMFWKFNSWLTAFGSANHGLSRNLPSFAAQAGIALAVW